LRSRLDDRFLAWLHTHYTLLAGQALPNPHHLYHIPTYLDYRHPAAESRRVALVVLDGLALADWVQIETVWRRRHPDWGIQGATLLAQIPTLTSISRQALVSGLRPAAFAQSLRSSSAEATRWAIFWTDRGLARDSCPYVRLRLEREPPPDEVSSARTLRLCAVDTSIDELIHGAELGTRHFHASLQVWLERASPALEAVLDDLLARGFTVYLTSDHGHTEAVGIGEPAEGIIAQTRSKRARVYADRGLAQRTQLAFAETLLWEPQGILPPDVWTLIALGRTAFASANRVLVSHGGLSIDEVVVPFVTLTNSH
jgi:hypothetical protein